MTSNAIGAVIISSQELSLLTRTILAFTAEKLRVIDQMLRMTNAFHVCQALYLVYRKYTTTHSPSGEDNREEYRLEEALLVALK